jgi:hypothetical protein
VCTLSRETAMPTPPTRCTFTNHIPEFEFGFKTTAAHSPRVVKRNRGGGGGEGIWLVWLADMFYCDTLGEATLKDSDRLKVAMGPNPNPNAQGQRPSQGGHGP